MHTQGSLTGAVLQERPLADEELEGQCNCFTAFILQ